MCLVNIYREDLIFVRLSDSIRLIKEMQVLGY